MKFSHISDTHLGQYRSKKERENDTYDAFKQAIEISIKDSDFAPRNLEKHLQNEIISQFLDKYKKEVLELKVM